MTIDIPDSPQSRVVDEYQSPVSSYQMLLRLRIPNTVGNMGRVTTAIGECGGDIGSVDLHEATSKYMIRDFRVYCRDQEHAREIVERVSAVAGIVVMSAADRTFQLHRRGKIEVHNKIHIRTNAELSHVYTPGVARISMAVHDNPESVWSLTTRANTVAVVTDGTAVLGLGDIGPEAAMPVMEGKSMLFKSFGQIDAWPICLATKDPDEIVRTMQAISPGFGGILLEDISAPRCFEIEERLKATLDIPVFHDDQHGTAVVVLAALINSLKIVNKRPENLKVIILGAGAAGIACAKMLLNYGVKNIIAFDRSGAIYRGRDNMNSAKEWLADATNPEDFRGSVGDAMVGADMFLGLSGPRQITADQVGSMGKDAIVMALSNPEPEIMPDLIQGRARIIATGRSDYANQVNNVLCFPGLFRGTLDAGARAITEEMKLAAAKAIAAVIPDEQLAEEYILPSVFNEAVARGVAEAVGEVARRTGNIRKEQPEVYF